jgi:hypothetical protein
LIVSGSIGAAAVSNNATLGGAATLNGDLTAVPTGTISPGTASSIGAITVMGAAQLAGTIRMKLDAANHTNDEVIASTLNYTGGTLIVSILNGSPSAGSTFQLFGSSSYPTAPFSSITLPTLSSGLAWQTNLTTDGTIKVVSTGAPIPPTISTISLSGGNVVLSGTNNGGSGTYHVLTSTNISLPLTNWAVLTNGSFNGGGNFSSTNTMGTNGQQFYILQVP